MLHYGNNSILYLGEIDNKLSKRVQDIKTIFERSEIRVKLPQSIDASLKSHAALITALALGSKAARRINSDFSSEDQLLEKSVISFRENLKALKKLTITILPSKFKYLQYIPKNLIIGKIKKLINSDFGRIALSGHANYAQEEMKRLVDDFNDLPKTVNSSRTVKRQLYSLCYK
ncbi:MAG: hypothetical protein BAJALOKI1v1_20005 [Promethearchaeota archaeon]|nr:MAG: hypothetical protein BAJALOKI1v1_20005 [Candidatus Lokiarchaeota archaeon]